MGSGLRIPWLVLKMAICTRHTPGTIGSVGPGLARKSGDIIRMNKAKLEVRF